LAKPIVVVHPAAPRARVPLDSLTAREREVAACIVAGLANRAIAARLYVTVATVKDHVRRILHKTGLSNRAAIAATWSARG
jgi:DNA-binding NarL/FixJ family response regulator